jgi:GNAT superfamily N-acetyltransferase
MPSLTFRPAETADSFALFEIYQAALIDLGRRMCFMPITGGDDPEVLQNLWKRRRPLFEHLSRTAETCWVAEEDGRPVGYARAICREGVRELTELFVHPQAQSGGLGRELLRRAFPSEGATHRVIIATTDVRALAAYLKAGVYARFPTYTFSNPPEPLQVDAWLDARPLTDCDADLSIINSVDRAILGHIRPADHRWLLTQSQGFAYYRDNRLLGYGYLAEDAGPFAMLDDAHLPAALAHAETLAVGRFPNLYFEVPLINRAAVDHLLARGFRLSAFTGLFMSDAPFGKFENYIFPSPPFFL